MCLDHFRLGPSASQAPVDSDQQMQEALRALGVLLANPYGLQTLVANLTGSANLAGGAPSTEFAKARRGEPASSKPTGAPPPKKDTMMPTDPPPLKPEDTKVDPAVQAAILAAASPAPTAVDQTPSSTGQGEPAEPAEVINSSTHRAAHARLARRMGSMEPTECPHMQRLWNGSRKDWGGASFQIIIKRKLVKIRNLEVSVNPSLGSFMKFLSVTWKLDSQTCRRSSSCSKSGFKRMKTQRPLRPLLRFPVNNLGNLSGGKNF